jgi:hypothetical protein
VEAATVIQPDIYVRRRVVESPSTPGRQPLSKPSDGRVVAEVHGRALKPSAEVHEDLARTVDDDVGDAIKLEQLLERSEPGCVAAQSLDDVQNRCVAYQSSL